MSGRTPGTQASLQGLNAQSLQMVLDTVKDLKKRLLTKENILEYDKTETFPEKTIRRMLKPDVGLQLLFIPEAYGGVGAGTRDCCKVIREVSKICLGISTGVFAIQLGADPLLVGGTEEQKAKWLGMIADGKALVAYAVTEPEAGSNLAALTTQANPVVNDAGEITGYKVNGSKIFISNGGYADFITLLADTPEGPTFFVVEKGTPGFEQAKGEEKHGIRASNTSPLYFSDVFVPVENIVGGVPGKGLQQANKVFGYTRLMVGAMGLGAADKALEIVIAYAKERIQFGGPLSEKQGYTHKLVVPNAVRIEAGSAHLDEIGTRLDSGEYDLQVEGSINKYFCTEAANKAADDAVQALGGYGYICEYEVEKIRRDAKITTIYEGTSEIQQNIISTFRWKNTRKTKGAFYREIGDEMLALETELGNGGYRFCGLAAHALNATIDLAHHHRLTREQYLMFQLADMMTYVEVGAALARKAARLTRAGDAAAEKFAAMSRIFARETAQLITKNAMGILLGTDAIDEATIAEFKAAVSLDALVSCQQGSLADMNLVADKLFARK
ncbi:MAG: acyl-CoA dehydrogenase family protein [Desulfobacterales bacterium]|jgi:alkylation response protein AidB-like acyl-CoA dehydrogenase|nr:acyl-CoA dehydrogenase family protein [Desulfobacterales bacterium]